MREMRAHNIRTMGEASPLDEIYPLVDRIMEIVDAESKGLKSQNPKVFDRAMRRTLEIGDFFMDMMARMNPTYFDLLWRNEHRA